MIKIGKWELQVYASEKLLRLFYGYNQSVDCSSLLLCSFELELFQLVYQLLGEKEKTSETHPNVNQHFVLDGFTLEQIKYERLTSKSPDQVIKVNHKE